MQRVTVDRKVIKDHKGFVVLKVSVVCAAKKGYVGRQAQQEQSVLREHADRRVQRVRRELEDLPVQQALEDPQAQGDQQVHEVQRVLKDLPVLQALEDPQAQEVQQVHEGQQVLKDLLVRQPIMSESK